MTRALTFGFIISALSSVVIGFFLNYFYSFEFDETIKILPIWKVVLVYFIGTVVLTIAAFFIEQRWQNKGLFALNALLSFVVVAAMGFPLKYTNTEIKAITRTVSNPCP